MGYKELSTLVKGWTGSIDGSNAVPVVLVRRAQQVVLQDQV
jgi:hypothetical protein